MLSRRERLTLSHFLHTILTMVMYTGQKPASSGTAVKSISPRLSGVWIGVAAVVGFWPLFSDGLPVDETHLAVHRLRELDIQE